MPLSFVYLTLFINNRSIEDGKFNLVDVIYLCFGAFTATGLAAIDVSSLSRASINVLLITMQLGSSVNFSLVPVAIRVFYLRRIIPSKYVAKPVEERSDEFC